MTDLSRDILSSIIIHNKYARYDERLRRRETWEEIVERNMDMHMEKYPDEDQWIKYVHDRYVKSKKVLPSMRSLQFAGRPILRNPTRIYNCAYMPASEPEFFSELIFLLLGGTGVGYSVQYRHVNRLPKVIGPYEEERRYVIGDSIEGWADAAKVLVESYFYGKDKVRFDYSDIRPKGSPLRTTGGVAPGPEPLRVALTKLEGVLNGCIGRQLRPVEVHDMACHLADAVLAGGIRRAAMISLFSPDDLEMMTCKSGNWWELNPQRGRANNSVILHRASTRKDEFNEIWQRVKSSGSGEPGIYWTNNLDWGTNPSMAA